MHFVSFVSISILGLGIVCIVSSHCTPVVLRDEIYGIDALRVHINRCNASELSARTDASHRMRTCSLRAYAVASMFGYDLGSGASYVRIVRERANESGARRNMLGLHMSSRKLYPSHKTVKR